MFTENKYSRWYFKIVEAARTTPRVGYVEEHHIIPTSMGGANTPENKVKLSGREHFIVHLLLTKMTSGNHLAKMKAALAFMTSGTKYRQVYIPCSRIFEMVKKARAEGTRDSKLGVPLSAEHRKAISMGLTGSKRRPRTESEIESIRLGNIGKKRDPMSAEHKAKIAAAIKGKKQTAETREKIKKSWEKRKAQCS